MRLRTAVLCAAAAAIGAGLAATPGCASPKPKSSRLAVDDIAHAARELAARLTESDFLQGRSPESERIVVAISKVENLTADIIPEPDRWYMMVKVRDSASIDALRRLRNIVFVVPREHLGESVETEFDRAFASGRRPTHEMTATFRGAVRAAGRDRTDAYLCELRITSLDTRELAWTGIVEFKKTAFGRAYD